MPCSQPCAVSYFRAALLTALSTESDTDQALDAAHPVLTDVAEKTKCGKRAAQIWGDGVH